MQVFNSFHIGQVSSVLPLCNPDLYCKVCLEILAMRKGLSIRFKKYAKSFEERYKKSILARLSIISSFYIYWIKIDCLLTSYYNFIFDSFL